MNPCSSLQGKAACYALLATVSALVPLGAQTTAISNTGQKYSTTLTVGKGSGYDFQEAISFTTGATDVSLARIVLHGGAFGTPTSFTLAIYSGIEPAGPTGLVTKLVGNTRPPSTAANGHPYTAVWPVTLKAKTTYWLVASAPSTMENSGFSWRATASYAEDAGGITGWSIGDRRWATLDGGATWRGLGGIVPQFSIEVDDPR